MAVIHFAHSNGFHAPTYRYFLEQLQPHRIQYLEKFGHDPRYNPKYSWTPLVDQLIHSIEEQQKPVVAVGHSLGAVVSLYAYYRRPELFSGLVLMDPPFFGFPLRFLMLASRIAGISGMLIPPAKKARKRRTTWESREEAYQSLKDKSLFRYFHPESFSDYINYGLVEGKRGGLELSFSAKEEYRIFRHTPFWLGSGEIHVPSFYLYSNRFEIGSPESIRALQKKFTSTEFIPIDAGHMFPLEQPEETAALIKQLIGL